MTLLARLRRLWDIPPAIHWRAIARLAEERAAAAEADRDSARLYEQAVRTVHAARVRACADCPACEAKVDAEREPLDVDQPFTRTSQ